MFRFRRDQCRGHAGSALLVACSMLAAGAQAETFAPIRLEHSLVVVPARGTARPDGTSTDRPTPAAAPLDDATYVDADRISGVNDAEVVAEGNADLRKRNKRMQADRITYREADAEVEAVGNVRLTQNRDRIEGPYLRLKTELETGVFEQPRYRIERDIKPKTNHVPQLETTVYPGEKPPRPMTATATGIGEASRLDFDGPDRFLLSDATYSTCEAPGGGAPDWYARGASVELDYATEDGVGRNTTLYFKGMPILYSPWLSFSLNNKRRSGLLAPSFGSSSLSGFQYAQPIYWNIAPNRDATFTPRIMGKRGLQLGAEFRYLDPAYNGTINAQILPNDKLTGTTRKSLSLIHLQDFGRGFNGNLTFNGVSDYRYFGDLSNSIGSVAQTNLLRQGIVSYGAAWWSASLMAQAYQTLQDPLSDPQKLNEPYRRMPQLSLAANRSDLPLGGVFGFAGELVQFRHPTKAEATRFSIYPQLSLPLVTAATYLTPKIGLHASSYSLSRQGSGVPDHMSRSMPVFSIDSGITFERSAEWFGKNFLQTLEPRLHYLKVPHRDQTAIPVFDSAPTDFNFATIFSENRYGGGDRIGDANQLTAMIASRLLDPDTGAEVVRGGIGQRIYFSAQSVGLPGEVLRSNRRTDVLGALSGRIAPNTFADLSVQYSPVFSRTERATLSARYQPDIGRVINASYRFIRDQIGQVDVSGQWPLAGRWTAVGRLNYSTKDSRLVENIAGFEYDAGCWALRGVVQAFATIGQTTNKALMIQIELKGLSSLGVGESVTTLLKRNIPGYGIINSGSAAVPFSID